MSWQCTECSRSFHRRAGLSQHMRAHRRAQGEQFSCQLCYQGFPTVTQLAHHPCPASPRRTKRVADRDRALIDRMMTHGVQAIVIDLSSEPPAPQRPFEEYLLEAVFA